MVKPFKYLLAAAFIVFISTFNAQETKKISDKKTELKNLRGEINKLEEEIRSKSITEKKSVELIERYNKQNLMLNNLINSIREQEKAADEEISQTETKITSMEGEIKRLKETYAGYIVYLYKYGREDRLKWLLGSENINQALVRYKYLEAITRQRSRAITDLKTKETELGKLQNYLITERDEKHSIAVQKQEEEKKLQLKLKEKKSLVASLRNDRASLAKELELKKKAENEIRGWITKLIEAENRREEARRREELKRKEEIRKKTQEEKETRTAVKSNRHEKAAEIPNSEKNNNDNFDPFVSHGSLSWPVSNGRIIRPFGENRNAKLNTVTMNYGIDIKTTAEAGVRAALEGVVSTVNWVPGYGSVLIITHKNRLRTVYGHLGEIYVSEGAKVTSSTTIGKVGESLEGNILHFEVWSERSNQNPVIWLSKK
ncbi:MAG: murein hydrolase activator EnvC family protein [Syntrophothermus sp.]